LNIIKLFFIFIRNNENLLNNFDEVFINQNDINDYCFTMPMENGKVVDLNHPQTVSII